MRIDLTPRANRSALADALAPLLAFLAALLVGGIVVAAMGRSPAAAFAYLGLLAITLERIRGGRAALLVTESAAP